MQSSEYNKGKVALWAIAQSQIHLHQRKPVSGPFLAEKMQGKKVQYAANPTPSYTWLYTAL